MPNRSVRLRLVLRAAALLLLAVIAGEVSGEASCQASDRQPPVARWAAGDDTGSADPCCALCAPGCFCCGVSEAHGIVGALALDTPLSGSAPEPRFGVSAGSYRRLVQPPIARS